MRLRSNNTVWWIFAYCRVNLLISNQGWIKRTKINNDIELCRHPNTHTPPVCTSVQCIYMFINYSVIYQSSESVSSITVSISSIFDNKMLPVSVIKSALISFSTLTYNTCFLSKLQHNVNIRLLCLHNHVFLQRSWHSNPPNFPPIYLGI